MVIVGSEPQPRVVHQQQIPARDRVEVVGRPHVHVPAADPERLDARARRYSTRSLMSRIMAAQRTV